MAHTKGFKQLRRMFAVASWAKKNDIPASEAEAAFDKMLIDRRSAIKGASALAFLAVMPPALQGCGKKDDDGNGAKSVVVVGGGIAGLHCAWRLKEAGVDVTLYDAQNRVGGRMWTDRETFDGKLFEIGGELIDSNHETMIALAEEFGIELDDRWSFEEEGMVRETYWFNDARVTGDTLLQQTMAIADVMNEQLEAAESDDAAFEMWDNTSLEDWLNEYVPMAMYPELHEVLRIAYVGEYGLEADQQSVLNLHYLFGIDAEEEFLIFGDSDERWHTNGGNDRITTALADAIGADSIKMGSKLVKAAGPANGPYTLTFEGADGEFTAEAVHIVFALPFTLLREVDLADLELSEFKREIIDEIGYGTNAKIMGEFSSRPWWETHNESGLLTTDLTAQQGWDTTIGQDVASGGVWTNFVGGDHGLAVGQGTAEEVFQAALGDLEVIWPGTEAAWTGKAARMHWPTFQWAKASYTCYKPGQWQYWSYEGAREGNVHFCGEHCSLDFQGWMEGAAETGGLVAGEILMDMGISMSGLHARAVGSKLAVGQCYEIGTRADGRPRWTRRARRLACRTPRVY